MEALRPPLGLSSTTSVVVTSCVLVCDVSLVEAYKGGYTRPRLPAPSSAGQPPPRSRHTAKAPLPVSSWLTSAKWCAVAPSTSEDGASASVMSVSAEWCPSPHSGQLAEGCPRGGSSHAQQPDGTHCEARGFRVSQNRASWSRVPEPQSQHGLQGCHRSLTGTLAS